MADRVQVAVFTRVPLLGQVKTRLASAIGPEAALVAHQKLLDYTLDQVRGSGLDARVWVAGDPLKGDFDPCGFTIQQQVEGDLGQRMLATVTEIADQGDAALVVGSDCPVMSAAYLLAASRALAEADVVIGPTEDGGYGLIGMRRPIEELFLGMRWSVADVCRETLRRAEALNLSIVLMPTLWDVDTVADWRRWRALSAGPT